MTTKKKRKRGAQPGNNNARKHGLYAKSLDDAEVQGVRRAECLHNGDPALVLIRLRLQTALRHNPSNTRALREARQLINRWFNRKYHLDGEEKAIFRVFVSNTLVSIARKMSGPAGTNQAKMPESHQNLPERIEAKTAPSPPTPASKRQQKVKPFLPVFNETNQPRSSRERLIKDFQDDKWGMEVKWQKKAGAASRRPSTSVTSEVEKSIKGRL